MHAAKDLGVEVPRPVQYEREAMKLTLP